MNEGNDHSQESKHEVIPHADEQKNSDDALLYPNDRDFQSLKVDNEALIFEKKRRNHLFLLAYLIVSVIAVFYITLIIWIFCSGLKTNAWHTTLILAAIPTSLCFALLRVASKPEHSSEPKDLEANQTLLKNLSSMLINIIDAMRGK